MQNPKQMKTSAILLEMVSLIPRAGHMDLSKVDPTGGKLPAEARYQELAAELDERVPLPE